MKKTDELKIYGSLPAAEVRKALRKRIQTYQLEHHHRLTSGQDHWDWFFDGQKPDAGQWSNRLKFIWAHTKKGISPEMRLRKIETATRGKSVIAFIQDGRWIAACPDCYSQEGVSSDEPIFVCLNITCFDMLNNYWPRPVKFPTSLQQEHIAGILLLRINPINRNYHPERETIKDLEQENEKYGLPKNLAKLRQGE